MLYTLNSQLYVGAEFWDGSRAFVMFVDVFGVHRSIFVLVYSQ